VEFERSGDDLACEGGDVGSSGGSGEPRDGGQPGEVLETRTDSRYGLGASRSLKFERSGDDPAALQLGEVLETRTDPRYGIDAIRPLEF
jgi:hypothetical protein